MRCQSYLEQTVADFETVERVLLGQDFANFKRVVVGGVVTTAGVTLSAKNADEDECSWFAKFVNNDLKTSGSVPSGEKSVESDLWGGLVLLEQLVVQF